MAVTSSVLSRVGVRTAMGMTRSGLLLLVSLLLGACSIITGDQARVRPSAFLPPPLGPEMLEVTVTDGSRTRTLTGDKFQSTAGWQHNGPELRTRTRGTLHVRYQLKAPDGQVASTGSVEIPLKRDWTWGVDIRADTANPARVCFGCSGSHSFALHPSYRSVRADSVYVVWGGSSIRNPEIY